MMAAATPRPTSIDDMVNLIRLHPREGEVIVDFEEQRFAGLSPDVFIALNYLDHTTIHERTVKLNVNIDIDPSKWSTEDFFRFFTQDISGSDPFKTKALQKTLKCQIHGDIETNLIAHPNLLKLLNPGLFKTTPTFKLNGIVYTYHSIGVAANPDYGAAGQRMGNDYENSGSHFEIKFKAKDSAHYLCLNVHLHKRESSFLTKVAACRRLSVAIRLFYRELGLFKDSKAETSLQTALTINLDNFERFGYSCRHTDSRRVLEKYREAIAHKPRTSAFSLGDYLPPSFPIAKPTVAAPIAASMGITAPSSAVVASISVPVTGKSWAAVAAGRPVAPASARGGAGASKDEFTSIK